LRHVTTRFAGLVILIAGIWGALIPFVGPYFHFVLGPDQHWKWTTGRLWLNVPPGAVAALGGLILMGGGPRVSGRFGALMALAAGVWFIVGPDVSMLWNHGVAQTGVPHGRHTFKRFLEFLTFHSGLGALITALAAYSLPGVKRHVVEREVAAAETGAAVGGGGRRGRGARDAEFAAGGAAAGAAAEHHHDRREAEREGGAGTTGVGTGAAGTGAGTAGTGAGAGTAGAGPGATGAGAGTAGTGAGAGGAGMANQGGTGAVPATGPGGSRRSGGLLSRLFGRT
jgi:hypothetical protein